jgi:hypothetical protein
MGNKLKAPVLVSWATGEACLRGGVISDISMSVDAAQAQRHRARRCAIRDGNVRERMANGK